MSRRYSPEHRALILRILVAYRGNVREASRFAGVPERTLREWRLEEWRARRRQSRS